MIPAAEVILRVILGVIPGADWRGAGLLCRVRQNEYPLRMMTKSTRVTVSRYAKENAQKQAEKRKFLRRFAIILTGGS